MERKLNLSKTKISKGVLQNHLSQPNACLKWFFPGSRMFVGNSIIKTESSHFKSLDFSIFLANKETGEISKTKQLDKVIENIFSPKVWSIARLYDLQDRPQLKEKASEFVERSLQNAVLASQHDSQKAIDGVSAAAFLEAAMYNDVGNVFVASDPKGNGVYGMSAYTINKRTGVLKVESVISYKRYQGIGSALMSRMYRDAPRGVMVLVAFRSATNFYNELGGEVVGRTPGGLVIFEWKKPPNITRQ